MEPNRAYQVLTKLEAAERQLRVAIRLFFERRDMVAVHTLAAAAQEILAVLARQKGLKSIYELVGLVEKEDIKTRKWAQNFLKHGSNDPEEELAFFPEMTMFLLYDASASDWRLHSRVMSEVSPEVSAFLTWFWGKYPAVLPNGRSPKLMQMFEKLREMVKNFARYDFDDIVRLLDEEEKDRASVEFASGE